VSRRRGSGPGGLWSSRYGKIDVMVAGLQVSRASDRLVGPSVVGGDAGRAAR
jgi:hypothetical protein